MKKAAGVFGFMVVMLLMAAAVFTFLAPHFGWRVDVVLSGSMEPRLHAGGVAVTRPVAASAIRRGDIITFTAPVTNKLTTHRVVEIEDSPGLSFRTRGDANEEADIVTVAADSVVGTVCFDVPYAGYAARFVKSFPGLLICLCLPGLAIVIAEVRNIRRAIAERYII